ncbi:MAG: hypothetical protein HQ446_10285 [Polaromonas sp.]|nr:hypothetical protein [Polaromonas sp.]
MSQPVSSNDEAYLAEAGERKLGWRQVRRAIYFKLSGQEKYCKLCIMPSWKRGLWFYKGIPQIGDALMDLAPRSLLARHGLTMDLYTDGHIADLFTSDPWFEKVLHDPALIQPENYDFAIVPSFKRRSLNEKITLVPRTPWISVHGFYTGPEFHRGEFTTRRLLDALGKDASAADFLQHSMQKLIALDHREKHAGSVIKLAFAIGGVDPLRTYGRWIEVADQLGRHAPIDITLIGSKNGYEAAKLFELQWKGPTHNLVAKTSLSECRQIIGEQDVLIACDGGLMHLGVTTDTEVISLFTSTVDPHWRLPPDRLGTSLQASDFGVNAIDPADIVRKVINLRLAHAK